ncbi:transcriptional regulator [Salmonella bongori]|uniref:Uncharacterized protein n=4 Tax=Salmonella bongori TaxID=54736 RepID=S5MXY3_SALBN|nr:hypothetical protein A464_2363 [Salmonella bongori N268-08]ASG54128.1 transcriptional regulator [Salmonella bongori serovar 66:z41:- str. SA19983605]ECC8732463.1 transcriptional regulator [Salmonella bongori]ECG8260938.1 transcriptional regulator [Salmonella bongori serovar 48:i:-]HAC6696725.1 transcriptional regulator [Salmonella bongori serovar 44:r:-]
MIIVFSAEIVQIHHIAGSVNFTLISAWVSSKTCKRERIPEEWQE